MKAGKVLSLLSVPQIHRAHVCSSSFPIRREFCDMSADLHLSENSEAWCDTPISKKDGWKILEGFLT